jgi:3-hydroxyacyl-[acyl-carrier-protein] dehydratase
MVDSTMELTDILKLLPHRYPILLVDRVLELAPGKRVVALKNVTANESFFQGHFPGYPVMPGVLIVEAMAQAGCVMMLSGVDDPETKVPFFAGIDRCKFRRPVVPGDQLRLELDVLRQRGGSCKLVGKAMVGEELAAEAEIMAVLGERA